MNVVHSACKRRCEDTTAVRVNVSGQTLSLGTPQHDSHSMMTANETLILKV
jgi:hypothetical protein